MIRLYLLLVQFCLTLPILSHAMVAGDSCSTSGSVARTVTSGTGVVLVCNGSTWNAVREDDVSGRSTFNKSIKIGDDTGATCDASLEGNLRYNSADQTVELCNGTGWAAFTVSAGHLPTPHQMPLALQI